MSSLQLDNKVCMCKACLEDPCHLQAYKYVPFGEVEQVIPYLVRRAQENSSVLGGVQKEKNMVFAEIRRRLLRQPAKQQPDMTETNLGH